MPTTKVSTYNNNNNNIITRRVAQKYGRENYNKQTMFEPTFFENGDIRGGVVKINIAREKNKQTTNVSKTMSVCNTRVCTATISLILLF